MPIDVNIAQKEGGSITLLPKGNYILEVLDAQITAAKSSGNPQLALELRVCEGEHMDATFKKWFSATEKAAWRLQQFLEACDPDQACHTMEPTGKKDEDGNDIERLNLPDENQLIGLDFSADCIIGIDNKDRRHTDIEEMYALEAATPAQPAAQAAPPPPPAEAPPVAAAVTPPATPPSTGRQAVRRSRARTA